MGQTWDGGDVAFVPETWAEVLRVLKPGGHLVAFGATRTYHRLAVAIEDSGFELRDMVAWVYGSGFPKSHDVSEGHRPGRGRGTRSRSDPKAHDIRGRQSMEAAQGKGRGLTDICLYRAGDRSRRDLGRLGDRAQARA